MRIIFFIIYHSLPLLIKLLGIQGSQLRVPPSFSNNQKSYIINSSNVTHQTILSLLSNKLELDSHINVVLLGEIFTDETVKIISDSVNKLSKTASYYFPYYHLYEKILFHISTDKGLEKRILKLRENDKVFDDHQKKLAIDDLLNKYQENDDTSTTLFVFHSLFLNTTNKCGQSAYISQSKNIAWLDLSVDSSLIAPPQLKISSDMIHYSTLDLSDSNKWHKLSSIVFQSAESLIPVPYNTKIDEINLPPEVIDILVVNICMDITNTGSCNDNDNYVASIKVLANSYSSSTTKIGISTISLYLSKEPSLLYDFYKSVIHDDTIDDTQTIILSSEKLLYWLSENGLIKYEISKVATVKGNDSRLLIPVFYMQNVDQFHSYFIDKPSNLISSIDMKLIFDHHWGQSIDESNGFNEYLNDDLQWPEKSLMIINNKKDFMMKVPTGLLCQGAILYSSLKSFIDHELFFQLRSVIWQSIPHPKYQFNPISNSLIENYMWYNSPSNCNDLEDNNIQNNCFTTFREKRIVKRSEFILRAEYIISKLYTSIKETAMEVPDLDINKLFVIDSIKRIVQTKSTKLSKQIINKNKWRDDTKNIFEEFLILMDEAIIDFSHLYYDNSLLKLNDAESYSSILIDRLKDISKSKSKYINCDINDKQKPIIESYSSNPSNIFIYICLSCTISGILGYYYASTKDRSITRYRRH